MFPVSDSRVDIKTATLSSHPHGGLHAGHLLQLLIHGICAADAILHQLCWLLQEPLFGWGAGGGWAG